jgi:hypothetical protein
MENFEYKPPRFMPISSKHYMGGMAHLFKFANGYGASVVQHEFSYGGKLDLWELAVVKFDGANDDKGVLCFDTGITDDVMGFLKWDGLAVNTVESVLERIQNLERGEL